MMKQQVAALAVEAATMLARGEGEVFDMLAERTYELFGADGGVGVTHVTHGSGGLEIRLSLGGVPPMGRAWMERAKDSPRGPPASSRSARAGPASPCA